MSVRFQIAAVIYMMVQGVLFGVGIVAILAGPAADQAPLLIPALIAGTAAISLPISWFIAPRLRLRGRRSATGR
jgi:hypothetical protein